ncbi:hypothetical protein [Streptomyces roseochromogenus]|uniref:DUF8175 domain-containing protein n=1 Tax=Streptomyces roseochromogenus subsp. oscitans DS 12.976 TaxID=1352936 RepID=V6K7T9_STRRC|nr:hypothetical protein [Streptomyces roseochromogenus]EST28118.1 hypothetical protein M878_23015 [Streptomyces roseochromogenus subsp. oscitans DS 12.976]
MNPGDEQSYPDYGDSTGHTRTRLPENDPYGGAPRRTPRRASCRSLVTVVGVVVLLIAAIAFANRGDHSSTNDSTTKGSQPQTSTTAPSGTRPVETKTGTIPSGFARTEQGAQSAAANYAVALGSADMFNIATRHEIVNTVYAPDVAPVRQSAMDNAYSSAKFLSNIGLTEDGTAPKGQTFISRVIPVGTKVTASGADTATVEVWYTSLFGLSGDASTNPVTESWFTTTYQLTWADNDWKIRDFQQKDGPVPVGRDQKASTAEDMTKAVQEYGGFTYAR